MALLIAANLLLALWWHQRAGAPRRPTRLLLVTIDCLRDDYLRDASKATYVSNALALSRQGVSFERAYAQCDRTSFATACLLHGRFMSDGGSWPSLPEQLQRRGYATAAFLSSYVMLASGRFSLATGFDTFDCPRADAGAEWRPAEATTDVALQWMASHKRDSHWFLWVMFWDIHQATSLITAGAAAPSSYPSTYDAGAAASDRALGRLMKGLAETGQDDDTLVVLTANHGFSENAQDDALTEGLLHVPLVMRAPRWLGEPRRVSTPAMHVDVAPTALSTLDVPGEGGSGQVLMSALDPERPVFAETPEQAGRCVIRNGWQLVEYVRDFTVHRRINGVDQFVVRKRSQTRELFELSKDSNGKHDVIAAHRDVADALQQALSAWTARPGAVPPPPPMPTPDAAMQKALRKHGYW